MKVLTFLVLVVIGFEAHAASGDRVGNGGDVIVCPNRTELLDLYEMRLKGRERLEVKGDNPVLMAKEVINKRIRPLQPKRAELLLGYVDSFFEEAHIIPDIELNDIDDAGVVAIPKGCRSEQIIIQLADEDMVVDGYHRYTVNKNLWDKLDNYNQMALILHEVIYREMIAMKTGGTSMILRALVGQILSENMDVASYLNIINLFSDVEIKDYKIIRLNLKNPFTKVGEGFIEKIVMNGDTELRLRHNEKYRTKYEVDQVEFDALSKDLLFAYRKREVILKKIKARYPFSPFSGIVLEADKDAFFISNKGAIPFNADETLELDIQIKSEGAEDKYKATQVSSFFMRDDFIYIPGKKTQLINVSGDFNLHASDRDWKIDYRTDIYFAHNFWKLGSQDAHVMTNNIGNFSCRGYGFTNKESFYVRACGIDLSEATFKIQNTAISGNIPWGTFSMDGTIPVGDVVAAKLKKDVCLGQARKGLFKKEVCLKKDFQYTFLAKKGATVIEGGDGSQYELSENGITVNSWPNR